MSGLYRPAQVAGEFPAKSGGQCRRFERHSSLGAKIACPRVSRPLLPCMFPGAALQIRITFSWVPAHMGIKGNEAAHSQARNSTDAGQSPQWETMRGKMKTTVPERFGDIAFWAGGWSNQRQANGQCVDGEKSKWETNLAAVRVALEFAQATKHFENDINSEDQT